MKKSAPIRRRSVVEEIEPRILYSADFNPGLLAAAPLAPPAEQRTLDGGGDFIQQSTQVAQTAGHEVVFVDTAVPDYQKLVDDITANSDAEHQYDVVLLKSSADGIKQISETLVGMHEVSAVHIISHGSDGQVQLGDAALNFDSLLKNASQIKGWGQALASGADLLIYGCDVAEYADGKALMNALFRLTGADVAASTDATGAAALGGNWDLEYRTGATITPFAEPGWNGVLATQTLDWDAQTWAGGSVGPHSYAVGGGNVTVTIQPNFSAPTQFTNGTPELNTNNQGGLPVAENGLNIGTNGFQPGEEAVITIGFSHPGGVSNVSFSVFDIDTGGAGGFIDEVQAGYTASGPVTLTITPSADNTLVAPDTVRGTSQGSQNGPNSGDANAIFSFTGSGITQITMHYRNVGNSNNEAITLHDITFDDNAPPVLATGSVLGYTENQAASAINSAITVSDVDSATLASATVSVTGNHASGEDVLGFVNNPATMGNISGSYNAATGVMSLTSAGATATTAQWQVALRAVTYLDSSNNPSTLARTISYVVNDGAANSNTVTSTVNITAVNDAPALAGGSVLAYTENQAATAINTAITVSDVDNATLASATVSITGNFASGEDVLGFVNGAGMGNIAGAYNALTGVMTLSSAGATATVAQWQTALRAVTYLDSSNNPSTLARTISYVVNDGAANSNTVTSTVNITAVNDAPTLSGVPATYAATEQTTLNLAGTGITVGDVDGGPPGSETLTLSVVSGVLNAAAGGSGAGVAGSGSNTLTLTGTIAQLNNLLTGAAGATLSYINNSDTPPASDTLSLSINDNGNSGSGGAQTANASSTINITAVNDAPTLVIPGAQATGMNAPIIFSGANLISAGDVDAGAFSEQITVSVTQGTLNLSGTAGLTLIGGANGSASMTYQGTLASLNAALNGLTYTPNLNYAGADTLSIASDDLGNSGGGGALGANGTVNLTVQANQAPTLSATANNPTFQEAAGVGTQAAAVNVFSAANANAVEAGQSIIGLDFTVGGLLDGANERIVVDGTTITLGANSSGTTATNGMAYTVNIAGGMATVSLTSAAGESTANINTLINGITYQDTNTDTLSAGGRVFTLTQIQDNGGTVNGGVDTSVLATASTVSVVAVNDAPTAAAPVSYAVTEQTLLDLTNSGLVVGDVDALGGSETVTVSVVSGVLNATAGGTGVGMAGSGSNTLTLTGTVAQLNNLLTGAAGATLSYINNLDTPPATDTLMLAINDNGNSGSGGAQTANASSTINITAVNDAPTAAAPVSYAVTEQTLLDLTNSGLVVGDVDALGGSETVTVSVVSGVLNATAGGTGVGMAGSGSNTLTLTGTIAQLNNLLTGAAGATLSYINNSDTPPVTDTLALAINDNGNSGSGGAQTASASSTINITAVNDAPTLVIPGAQATGMNAPIIFSGANLISAGDADAGAFSEQITLSVTQGTLNLSGTAGLTLIGGANGSASMTYQGTLASLNAALNGLTYTPNLNYAGADTLSIASDDLGNSGGGGALGANGTVNLTVQANQAPTLSATANNPTFTEAAGLGTQAPAVNVFSAANAGTVEAGQNTIGLSFTVGGLLDGASECVVVDGSAITLGANSVGVTATNGMGYTVNIVAGTATVTLSKPAGVSAANINALINGITYQNTNTDNPSAGNRVFSVSQIQDSGGTANGGQDTTALATTSTVNVMPVNDAPFLVNDTLAIVRGGSVVLSSPNLSATDIDSPAAGLTFSVSNVLDGQFEMVSTPGVAITSFTQGAIVGGQVRFVHDGSISPPAFDLTVSDGTLSAGPTAATIVFSVPAGGPIIAPPTPTPPAPASNPGNTPPAPPPSSQVKPAQPVVTPVVTLSGGLPMAPEPVGIELYEPIRGANPYLQVDARPPKANLNPAPLIKPAEQTLLIAGTDPQYMEFGPLTKVDWSAQTAFPSADRNPSEHDQIMVIMESVRMGGIALSVGVVWWASRVTGLIGSLLASMPAWRQLDPLPIVGRDEEEDRWEETEDSEADADELAVSMVLEGPRSRDPVSA